MSFYRRARIASPFVFAVLALGLTACTSGAKMGPTPSVVTVTESAAEPMSMQPTSAEPTAETSVPAVSETPGTTVAPNDEKVVVDVTVVGDESILALQYSGAILAGADGPTNQMLITGPGGCLAITNEGKPKLLVFPADTTFALQEGKPSATFAGTEHGVGSQFAVATTAVAKTSVAGIPDRCLQGSDNTVLVVN